MMSIHESIDEARDSPTKLRQLLTQNQQSINDTCTSLTKAFENRDWNQCLALTHRLSYLTTISQDIQKLLPHAT